MPGKGLRQPVAERVAQSETGGRQIDGGTLHPLVDSNAGRAHGRGCGSQVQQALAVNICVGIDAALVGRRQEPRDQIRIQ